MTHIKQMMELIGYPEYEINDRYNGTWLWTIRLDNNLTGLLYSGSNIDAHRIAWNIAKEPNIPIGSMYNIDAVKELIKSIG